MTKILTVDQFSYNNPYWTDYRDKFTKMFGCNEIEVTDEVILPRNYNWLSFDYWFLKEKGRFDIWVIDFGMLLLTHDQMVPREVALAIIAEYEANKQPHLKIDDPAFEKFRIDLVELFGENIRNTDVCFVKDLQIEIAKNFVRHYNMEFE